MKVWLKENKMYLLIAALVILTIGIYFLVPAEKDVAEKMVNEDWLETENEELLQGREDDLEKNRVNEEPEKILVDVKGAVLHPGVYEAFPGDRVLDMINQAGGLLETAERRNINFALKVADEMVVYIPMIGEESVAAEVQSSITSDGASKGKNLVNLNTASNVELETLPGIGPSKAAAIIEYRETNSRFRSVEELKEISGIGDKTFEKLKEHITVN